MKQGVVISGMGLISPLGQRPDDVWQALLSGRSAITQLPAELDNGQPTAAARVEFDPAPWFSRLQLSGVDRVSQMAVAAAELARDDAALPVADLADAGVYMGCSMGGAAAMEQAYARHFSPQPRLSPLSVVANMSNAPAAHIALRMQAHGPVINYATACASSAMAIGEAARAIAAGDLDLVLAGGAEAMLVPGVIRAWQAMQTLAALPEDGAHTACRPFSQQRSGLVLGEGAVVLVLENEARARARGARIYARLSGFGMSCDASHLTRPDAGGQVRAIRQALRQAGLQPSDVGYVNAHGTATRVGDSVEAAALGEVWGEQCPPVSSTKAMHGHLLGAAGAMEAAITALAVYHRQLPPSLFCADADCAIELVGDVAQAAPELQAALSNSFAFGGSNAVLAFRRAD